MEKAHLPSPAEHPSFQNHRRQLWTQILTPLLIAVALMLALSVLIGLVTFRDNGEVGRWAAISTIWIVIPIMVAGLIFLVIFGALIYGMARLLQLIPPCTGYAQRLVWRAEGYVKRAADAIAQPIVGLGGILATIRRVFGSK